MSNSFSISAPRVFDGTRWQTDAIVVVEGGLITQIGSSKHIPSAPNHEALQNGFVAPGFVDVQVNGGGGVLLNNDPTVDGIRAICATHARFGTTALLPTLITDTPALRDITLAAGAEAAAQNVPGFAGLHLEGPHLSHARKGAHDPQLIRPMNDEDLAALVAGKQKLPILVVTIAAESVTPDQVRALVVGGIKVSIGHCNADFDAVKALIDAGANMITHLFNAMSPLTSREPGMVGAALDSADVYAGLIADSHHVKPAVMNIALRAKKGPGRVFLISDAMSPVGTDVKELVLNNRRIVRENGKLLLEDGTLAGADLEMASAVRVLSRQTDATLEEALRMASLYPAEAVGLSGAGRLAVGLQANFVHLNDNIEQQATWIAGQKSK